MKLIPAFILLTVLQISGCCDSEKDARYFIPAEFEDIRSTGLVWSADYYGIVPKLASIISKYDRVTLYLGNYGAGPDSVRKVLTRYGSRLDRIEFIPMDRPLDNIWIRDFGPVYLLNGNGQIKMVQFDYFWSENDFVEELGMLTGTQVIESEYNSSGGSRELNGEGTLILVEAHERYVNKDKSLEEIEKELMEKLHVKKIIWLKRGIPQDDSILDGPLYETVYPKGVHGHVDEFCRFVDPNTILISRVTKEEASRHPVLKEAKMRLDENIRILRNATDQDGRKFKVIEVPVAPVLISDRRSGAEGKIIASVTSYMNFIISNSLVILPSYVSAESEDPLLWEKEQVVRRIIRESFPGREVIPVRADTINYYSGGFHCLTIHEPMTPAN